MIDMEILTTITPKFQVHIPVSVRRKIGLRHSGRAVVKVEKDQIVIKPIKSGILTLAGKFKVTKPIPAEKVRGFINYS